ncbi:hypothetical protein [Thiocapsa roseopersicina]|uniref:Uncharacterized protein n=1 Tax=Thiocapsa roseopersicina TaxID=1058 RepID=A0A1H2YAU0_THIRO|nr:hypothetical protein [Thiocapsa roseopersicina]SDX02352.1 hypothetical protein SAMN05421783_112124 [Thiocapsa roseopersicina]
MPHRRDPTGRLALSALSRADARTLRTLELEWPDAVGLLARVALLACPSAPSEDDPAEPALAMMRAGIAAYRRARSDGEDDLARFAAFVDGITLALARRHQYCVARALTEPQRRVLARRVPPRQPFSVG